MKLERLAGERLNRPGRPVDTERPARTDRLMEEVCERDNLKEALRRVQANKGSAGVDGMTVDDLTGYLAQHWPAIRAPSADGDL